MTTNLGTQSSVNKSTIQANVDKAVAKFVEVRDRIKQMEEAHAEAIAKLKEQRDGLKGWLQEVMVAAGAMSIRTAHGTCSRLVKYRASLADPGAFMKYVIDNQKFELLDRRANVTAVKDFVQETGQQPPGCNLTTYEDVGVRRVAGSKLDGSTGDDNE